MRLWIKLVSILTCTILLVGCGIINAIRPASVPKPWLTANKRKIEPIKTNEVPARPFSTRTLTQMAGSPALRFFENSENKLAHITWKLSDWDRTILDGDIQRTMNNPASIPFFWAASNPKHGSANLLAKNPRPELQKLYVRRLHILNQTPRKVEAVTGQWRSWGGALLRAAPTLDRSKVIGRLAPASKFQILAKVRGISGEFFYLIGVKGIGVGYVKEADLTRANKLTKSIPGARPSFNRRVNLDFAPTLRDPVEAIVLCRTLSVAKTNIGACKGLDGRWRAI